MGEWGSIRMQCVLQVGACGAGGCVGRVAPPSVGLCVVAPPSVDNHCRLSSLSDFRGCCSQGREAVNVGIIISGPWAWWHSSVIVFNTVWLGSLGSSECREAIACAVNSSSLAHSACVVLL